MRTLPLHPGAEGLRDDTAVMEVGGERLVLTHDAIAEGVHYRPGTDPFDIAWKLVAVNLSDLAAKGAEPLGVLIGAVLVERAERFVEGLRAVLTEYDVPLLGGDTISVSPATFGCTAIGRATSPRVPRRDGARPGDALWVTGPMGAAMLGFEAGTGTAYLRPRPRLSDGRALAAHVHAMMDVSDGLLLDASRMAEASGCTAEIRLADVPIAAGADPLRAVTWGDDYELLFAAPADFTPPVAAARIGHMTERGAVPLLLDGAAPDFPLGYQHR
ncbi:thiamine-phosphate kinase [Sphingomonas sp. R-74633]|uniref:thiamine-phosphate kinase n=1 Tax=Sphingomonas sp. R-74633 TaxID=2751188 RepID=UPI00211E1E6B|nr:thiamine-phosphate kinase [Sphingomonas sp. R-74633]